MNLSTKFYENGYSGLNILELLEDVHFLKSYITINKRYELLIHFHKIKKEFIRDIQMNIGDIDWLNYKTYLQKIYPQYGDLETIYEYFLVFNKEGLKDNFFLLYEKLQSIKEACDVMSGKKIVVGSAEGVSIQVAAKITDTQIQKDVVLFELVRDKIKNDSR